MGDEPVDHIQGVVVLPGGNGVIALVDAVFSVEADEFPRAPAPGGAFHAQQKRVAPQGLVRKTGQMFRGNRHATPIPPPTPQGKPGTRFPGQQASAS